MGPASPQAAQPARNNHACRHGRQGKGNSRGVMSAENLIRIDNARLCFCWPHVVTFAAVYGNRFLDSAELRRVALDKVFAVASGSHRESDFATSSYHEWYRVISDYA